MWLKLQFSMQSISSCIIKRSFILCLALLGCVNLSNCLYEDQIGKFDW